jgi:hypothetical protein
MEVHVRWLETVLRHLVAPDNAAIEHATADLDRARQASPT